MNQIYPDASLVPNLRRLANGDLHYNLTTTAGPYSRSTTLSSLHAGYAGGPLLVLAADFTLSGVAAHLGSLTALDIALPNDMGIAIDAAGYYVTDVTDTFLVCCAAFDAPVHMLAGDTINITPKLGDSSRFAS